MLEHIQNLKNTLIQEFFQLYEQYEQDQIYACVLVFNEYLGVDYLAVSSQRNLFNEQEDEAQYLSEVNKWNIEKWRYRTQANNSSGLHQFKNIFADMNRYGVFSEKSSQKYYQLNSKSIFLHIQSALDVMRDFYIICIANVGIFCLSLL